MAFGGHRDLVAEREVDLGVGAQVGVGCVELCDRGPNRRVLCNVDLQLAVLEDGPIVVDVRDVT